MKKHGRAIAVTAIAGFVIAGYFLSQAVLAAPAQSGPPKPGGNQNNAQRPLIGKVVAVPVAMDQVGPIDGAVAPAMGKTINIPPAAFVPDGFGGSYICDWDNGYLNGNLAGLNAPVIFPKGAKKILHVDYYVYDDFGSSIWCGMVDSYPWNTNSKTYLLSIYSSTPFPGYVVKYICTPTDKTIRPDHVYYLPVYFNSNTGYLYGAIVYYQ